MGYAGYVPAKLPPGKLTPAQAALMGIKSAETLEVIGKLMYNCAIAPKEEKYRKIRLTNEKIQKLIVSTPGALDSLYAMGWVDSEEDSDFLTIPAGTYMTMKEVRMIEDAKEKLQKDIKEAARA